MYKLLAGGPRRKCAFVVAWLLGLLGANGAYASVDPERDALRARVDAVRAQLEAADAPAAEVAQWLNWPNWGNWNNWNNWFNWFNR